MFGGKITTQGLRNVFNNVKNHATMGYHKTREFLGNVDHGFKMAKRIYGAIAPVINNVAGTHHAKAINNHVMKAVGGYEQMRNKVMDAHDAVAQNVGQAVGGLRKAGVHINL
jgi:hypothetical protein